jgi:histidinol phosphatase-like enzyme (inositol monophosphatase family)
MTSRAANDWSAELEVALEAARASGESALSFFGKAPRTRWKDDNSPVTEADHAAEALILERIRRTFPDDALLAEESGAHPGRSGRRWIVDPIDGTRWFIRGRPFWCTLIGLEAGGEIVVGVLHFPALGRLYGAGRGLGAWRDGARLAVRDEPDAARALLVLGELDQITETIGAETFRRLVRSVGSSSSHGAGYGAALLLDGHADAWLECDVSPWDIAPFGVLFEEAGARFTDPEGRRVWPTRSGLAAGPALHAQLLPLVRPSRP